MFRARLFECTLCTQHLHLLDSVKTEATDTHLGKLSIGGLMSLGGIYNDVHRCLTRDRGAEADRQQFDQLGLHLWIHVQHLHVASTETTPTWETETKHR